MARAGAPRPFTARRAAADFQLPLLRSVAAEIRWMFTPPRTCLMGVWTNTVLAALWLLVQPVTRHGAHDDLIVVVDTYFASFILADVTTTNLLGADHHRVNAAWSAGTPMWRILLVKNAALLVIVGLPTLAAAAAFTVTLDHPSRLLRTVPNVLVPVISWLGVGNLVSVLLPVAAVPLLRRWRRRHDRASLTVWAAALALPYALYYVADPIGSVEHQLFWNRLPAAIGPLLGRDTKTFVHLAVAATVWVVGTAAAVLWVRRRGLQMR
ncbi:hypothetical protein BST22_21140 [Mycolicibacterium chubuense]|uniref:ABC-2 family transporter protein n=1 Tax=Mycolicibacterium chubuense TaxID=1800 RepID=A0A0J6VRC9_MYCCU|nr:hypothetical protein [Mycolicibacterium chubuense]KMO72754.1 hypothetical protein MCHUDSM44219_04740 [Mycolicibacterium chubuense]ORA46749.1 hypothetical protein BST22_21140 [Mycolicibacterium chubuense]SPX99740.1 Uncharacterised protein [Mycolicibacterium chubuense]